MPKCKDCRKYEAINTKWENIRSWIFWHLFPIDATDEKANSFTSGFSDGYIKGREHQKATDMETIKLLSESKEPTVQLFPLIVDLEKVLTSNKQGQVFLNGVKIEFKKLEQLKGEVIMFGNTLLWEILTNTLDYQAQEIGWNKSKELQDLFNAKMIAYTVDIQKKILKKIEQSK